MANPLEKIKVGDRVWVSRRFDSSGKGEIKTVMRLTPTQIHLDGYKAKYKRGTPSRFGGEPSYFCIGRLGGEITAIATPQECAKWDADIERGKQESAKRATEAEAAETKREELAALFSVSEDDNRGTSVRRASYGDRTFRADKYDVTFHSLTESEVKEIARKVNQ